MLTNAQRLQLIHFTGLVPARFMDFFTRQIMTDPVVIGDGRICEKSTAQTLTAEKAETQWAGMRWVQSEALKREIAQFVETQEQAYVAQHAQRPLQGFNLSIEGMVLKIHENQREMAWMRHEIEMLKLSLEVSEASKRQIGRKLGALRAAHQGQKRRGFHPQYVAQGGDRAAASPLPVAQGRDHVASPHSEDDRSAEPSQAKKARKPD